MFSSIGKKILTTGGVGIALVFLILFFCYRVSDNEDVWVCKNGRWATTGIPSYPKPQDPCGKKAPLPQDKSQCLHIGGVWKRLGPEPFESCNSQTKDRGTICTDNGDCEGMCLADINQSEKVKENKETLRIKTRGRCSEWRIVIGCFDMVEKGYASAICVD